MSTPRSACIHSSPRSQFSSAVQSHNGLSGSSLIFSALLMTAMDDAEFTGPSDPEDRPPASKAVEENSADNRASTVRAASPVDDQQPGPDIARSTRDDERFTPDDRRQQDELFESHGHGRSPRIHSRSLLNLPSTSSHRFQDQQSVTMRDIVQTYAPLLSCPACSPPARLIAPTTLHCGHTVCAKHVRTESTVSSSYSSVASSSSLVTTPQATSSRPSSRTAPNPPSLVPVFPSCPLPTCRPRVPRTVITPNIPPDSSVAYYPPIAQPTIPGSAGSIRLTVSNPRLDVSIGRVVNLLENAEDREKYKNTEQELSEDSDGTDNEPHEEDAQNSAITRSGTISSPSITRRSRRRKRPVSNVRKRSRRVDHWDGRHHCTATREELEERFRKELTESLTCEICFMLLYQPVTTPCQHTFCAKCLQRSLDHGTKCPLCRQEMPPFSYFQDHPFNKVVLAILLKAFPGEYAERGRAIEEEERDGRVNTPIFVCQLSFPGIPTLLHFYEPRYRLMLRRCLESPKPCFGMIMPQRTVGAGSSDYGTILDIKSVQMLPDGRSIVETIGSHRFRLMETGTLDGYMVGRIERVDDTPQELEDEAERNFSSLLSSTTGSSNADGTSAQVPPPTTEELIAICHGFVEQLRNGTAPWVVERLNNTYGPMPDDVSNFSFWMAQVLPIEEHEKAKLLVIRSPRARLRLVVYWIEQLNSNWWFSQGCTIS